MLRLQGAFRVNIRMSAGFWKRAFMEKRRWKTMRNGPSFLFFIKWRIIGRLVDGRNGRSSSIMRCFRRVTEYAEKRFVDIFTRQCYSVNV